MKFFPVASAGILMVVLETAGGMTTCGGPISEEQEAFAKEFANIFNHPPPAEAAWEGITLAAQKPTLENALPKERVDISCKPKNSNTLDFAQSHDPLPLVKFEFTYNHEAKAPKTKCTVEASVFFKAGYARFTKYVILNLLNVSISPRDKCGPLHASAGANAGANILKSLKDTYEAEFDSKVTSIMKTMQ